MLKKVAYMKILERNIYRENQKKRDEKEKTPTMVELKKDRDATYKKYREMSDRYEDLLRKYVVSVSDIIRKFEQEWDEVSLILDRNKSKEAKLRLLDKYNLKR